MQSHKKTIRTIADVAFIVVGSLFLAGVLQPPLINFWVHWAITVSGILIASLNDHRAKRVGLGIALFGAYLVLRSAEIIAVPVLMWVIGIGFIVVGVVNLMRAQRVSTVAEDDKKSE